MKRIAWWRRCQGPCQGAAKGTFETRIACAHADCVTSVRLGVTAVRSHRRGLAVAMRSVRALRAGRVGDVAGSASVARGRSKTSGTTATYPRVYVAIIKPVGTSQPNVGIVHKTAGPGPCVAHVIRRARSKTGDFALRPVKHRSPVKLDLVIVAITKPITCATDVCLNHA